ncbi:MULTISPECIES: RagB/SusD family nutrient uptake outer membrane protein [Chryseobacterium]|uniref:SusD family n=2 Tax=Chryseobacterium gleum TaxID=250 RepID=A0A3S4MG73_CHRGE|nr:MULTISPECIES: RagB/SusD family nutrient uptake outer membrane protein [Chryseobacterium]EFK36072.1 tetratricopeptide repeat protein [Chryseobacterium gleum ATCC 35910]QQY31774.1 RagB/SusD family nutrient uptake outer membrane protein [Chryseobacterium gleum]VEE11185.1 SusD family [Chryseobacterium gleum]VFA44002.1 SusD family [Chryseobacterium indologenes]
MKNIIKSLIILTVILLSACSKEWLEEKQDIKLIVPTTLTDLDLLMNTTLFARDGRGSMEGSCDDFEVTVEQYNSLYYDFSRKLLTWTVDEFPKLGSVLYEEEWDYAYAQVQTCNVTLKALSNIKRTDVNAGLYDRIKGTALYHRSRAFLNLAMTFCKYYDSSTADIDLGIPLKLDEDINEPIFRNTLAETYLRIIQDLNESAILLPNNAISPTHITNAGAYALLARTYLYMNDYHMAYEVADKSLELNSKLDDYNSFNATDSYPLLAKSKEMHIQIQMTRNAETTGASSIIPDELYNLYGENDLRKTLFFKFQNGKMVWRGSLLSNEMSCTAIDEVFLIAAECAARLKNKDRAMQLLNTLLKTRFKNGKFVPLTAESDIQALDIILIERRKELLKRGLRFQDLKRLNKEPRYAKTLTRIVGENVYTLPPNDKRYILPIPQYIINYSGIEQN